MRGVSPILAIMLLLMITIAMTGAVYLFLQRSFTPVFDSSSSQADSLGRSVQTMMKIENIAGNKVYIRNVGSAPISNGSLGIYIGNTPVNYTLPADIPVGQVAEIAINQTWGLPTGGSELKITGIGATYSEDVSITPDASSVLSLGMDEGTGTVVYDASGYGNNGLMYGINNGTCYNMGGSSGITNCNFVPGKYGSAISFDGSNDYILTQYNGTFLQNMTVMGWVRFNTLISNAAFGRFHNTGSDQGWMLYRNTGDVANTIFWLHYYKNTGGTTSYVRPGYSGLSLDTWYHMVSAIGSDGTWRTYLNGAPYSSGTASSFASGGWGGAAPNPAIRMAIGKASENYGWYFNGSLDDVRVYDRTMSLDEISSIYNGTSNTDLRKGLVGEWKFEDGSVNTTIDTHMWTEGRFGKGLQFDGVDDYVDCGNSTSVVMGKNMTIAIWIYPSTYPSGWSRIVGKGNSTSRNYGIWRYLNGDILFQFTNAIPSGWVQCWNNLGAGDPLNVPNNVWAHIVGTYDGENMKVYRDGVLEKTCPTTEYPANGSYSLEISGMPEYTFNYHFKGSVDDVRIYNSSLTPEQILGFS